jgi:hypothetical protein
VDLPHHLGLSMYIPPNTSIAVLNLSSAITLQIHLVYISFGPILSMLFPRLCLIYSVPCLIRTNARPPPLKYKSDVQRTSLL